MLKSKKQNRIAVLLVSACIALGGIISCASTSPEMVKQEEGYYYGYGKGKTDAEAAVNAKIDLVSNALTAAVRAANPRSAAVKVTTDSAAARLGDIKPFADADVKKGATPAITYRIKNEDWDKLEAAYSTALSAKLSAQVASIASKKGAADKINEALAVLTVLSNEGEYSLLKAAGSSELLSTKVEAICKEASKNLQITLSVNDGIVGPSTKFSAKVTDGGKAVANLPLSIVWSVPALPTDAAVEAPAEVSATAKTDASGTVAIDAPSSDDFKNRPVTLSVSTTFAVVVPSASVLKKIDAANGVDGFYVEYDDVKAAYAVAEVPAGKFNAGAVPQDTLAGKTREAAHEAETGAYAIMLTPVTNAQYAAYLHATRAETLPEYFDNAEFNKGAQPVIGLSLADAEKYAAWLSEQTGNKYRLPTEEEWEKAARAGKDVVYPWGDDEPKKEKKANYKGNGKFKGPSPVGSFENGKNEWGLVDMAGNVWEWTSSTRKADPASTSRVVKGGSYLDGSTDLRISNFREEDSQKGAVDVGFRLVMEVSK